MGGTVERQRAPGLCANACMPLCRELAGAGSRSEAATGRRW